MNTLYIYLLIFACIGYLICTDENAALLFVIITHLIKVQYEKTKWIILNNPRNPIVRWNMERRAYKLAEELQKELEDKSK
jgi:aspartate/methionine/tyrosine aminotransferase